MAAALGAGAPLPTLTLVTLALFAVNVAVPDAIPFVDELILGLAALLLTSQRRKTEPAGGARVPLR